MPGTIDGRGLLEDLPFEVYNPRSREDPDGISPWPAPDNVVPPGPLSPLAARGAEPGSGALSHPLSPTSVSRKPLSFFIFTDQSRCSSA